MSELKWMFEKVLRGEQHTTSLGKKVNMPKDIFEAVELAESAEINGWNTALESARQKISKLLQKVPNLTKKEINEALQKLEDEWS